MLAVLKVVNEIVLENISAPETDDKSVVSGISVGKSTLHLQPESTGKAS